MSKKDNTNTVVEEARKVQGNNVMKEVDNNARWKEIRENLVLQLKTHLEQADYHKTMATKAQGAIEVGDQMHPQEEENNETK